MDSRNGNAKLQSNLSQQRARRAAGAHCLDDFWGVSGIPIGDASRKSFGALACMMTVSVWLFIWVQSLAVSFSCGGATASSHIFHVLTMCPEVQMIRADAAPVIARMQNHHSVRNRSIRQFIRTSMSSAGDAFLSVFPVEYPVSISKPPACPFPTL